MARLTSALSYKDPKAALKWLEAAFGFELVLLIEDGEGNLAHSQMTLGESHVMVGNEWSADHASPAGAVVLAEPATQFYGDRTYRCRDPEGHIWTVGQTVQAVTREEAEAATGLKIQGWA